MTRAALPGPTLVGVLWAAGLAGLAIITLASPGATRMFAWPWSLAFAAALLSPALIVILRAFSPDRPLVLPPRTWWLTALATAAAVLLAAMASPHRGPALLWSAPMLGGIACFLAAYDGLHAPPGAAANRPRTLLVGTVILLALTAATGLALWLGNVASSGLRYALAARNPHPLGHSNYTAGIALLLLPLAVSLVFLPGRRRRALGAFGALLALVTLFSSGSRGGLIGLAVLGLGGLLALRVSWTKRILVALALLVVGLGLGIGNPRTRAMLAAPDPAAAPNLSNVQRTAMLAAGWRMGCDRPVLGWGGGTTPLVFPRYRAGLEGGAENVLQLHSTPVQLWAEFGGLGVMAALVSVLLIGSRARARPAAATALAGYAAFSLFDWQLDVPLMALTVAVLAALLAPAPAAARPPAAARAVGGLALLALALVVLLGRHDHLPELNVRALALAQNPETVPRAIALLRESLARNPDQEIAHFNLGWLLVTADPAAAEEHFRAAARLVPDKGGVYFGIGLARLNRGQPDVAARAFALEGLNDPAFLASPWWREGPIAATRSATEATLTRFIARARAAAAAGSWRATQLERLASDAARIAPAAGPERRYQRERSGYPVLMRNLDLPRPVDVFVVREATDPNGPALPPKGWLPSPLLLQLLDEVVSAHP